MSLFKPKDTSCDLALPPRPHLPAEASEIMKSIGEAIQYLHSINIAHRDVKVLATDAVARSPWGQGPRVVLPSRGLAPGEGG